MEGSCGKGSTLCIKPDLKGCRVLIPLGIASMKTLAVNDLTGVFLQDHCRIFLVIVSLFSGAGYTENVVAKLQFLQTNLGKKRKAC